MLARYITEVQDMLNDAGAQWFDVPKLTRYINRSRRRIAHQSGCIRILPPGLKTVPRQEVYHLRDFISACQGVDPRIKEPLAVRSLAIEIGPGGWKPMWSRLVWTDFQARFRIYNSTFFGTVSFPGWWTQYGLGPAGRIYLAPIPTMYQTMELDFSCIPQPLLTDQDSEIIPPPWDDAVVYWAAVLCLLGQQRSKDATAMAVLFNNEMPMCASVVCPQMIQTPYGATIRSA